MKTKIKEYKHLLWLLFWPFQITWYCILSSYAREMPRFFTVHSFLDDFIPFIPFFVLFYYLWYVFVASGVLYFAFVEKDRFYKFIGFVYIEILLTLIFCTFFPNGHDFRPIITGDESVFHYLVNFMYKIDYACVNIMPSMHVMSSVGVSIAISESPNLRKIKWLNISGWILTILISLSTVFIKQHSILDVFVALIVCIPLYFIVYKTELFSFSKKTALK